LENPLSLHLLEGKKARGGGILVKVDPAGGGLVFEDRRNEN
jgi:hypothetical protein